MMIPKLKTGNIVVLRNEKRFMVIAKVNLEKSCTYEFVLIHQHKGFSSDNYTSELLHKNDEALDIMAIHKAYTDENTHLIKVNKSTLIWERVIGKSFTKKELLKLHKMLTEEGII